MVLLAVAAGGLVLADLPAFAGALPTVTLTVEDAAADEAGPDPAQFTLTRSADAGTATSLRIYLEILGSAERGVDYASAELSSAGGSTHFATIAAGQLARVVTLTPILDNLIENGEDITFSVLPPQLAGNEYIIGSPADGEATIADDVAEVTLTVGDGDAAEAGQAPAQFTLTRSNQGDTAAGLRVYLTLGGTAQRGDDYASSDLSSAGGNTYFTAILANQLSRVVTLTPITDNRVEGEESVTFAVSAPQLSGHDYVIGTPADGEARIADDVAEVTLTANDAAAAEAGEDPAEFTLTRSNQGNTAANLRVYLQVGGTAQRSADYASPDLSSAGGNIYFTAILANQLSRVVTLTPIADNLIEGEETAVLTLSAPQLDGHEYAFGSPADGQATISDDVAAVTLTMNDSEAAELGQDPAQFTLTRSNHGNTAVNLRVYLQVGGTAQNGPDYDDNGLSSSGNNTYFTTILANELQRVITLTPDFESVIEGDETAVFTLVPGQLAGNAYLIGAPAEGLFTILDFVDAVFKDGFEDLEP